MADKKSTFNISQATGTLPNGLIITYDGSDESIKNSPENQAAQNAEKKMYKRDQNPVPKFTLEDGKVSLSGGKINLSHPVVTEMETALSNAFRGADFTDKDVAAAFQKAATKANEQIQAQLNYEEYEDFLDHSGFSDSAYRNYSSARQEFEKPNVTSSTANVTTYDKNGKLVKKSIKEWFDYWKKEYNPEDRGQLWLKSLERAYNPTSDEDLYAAIPAILMGTNRGQNWLQGLFQLVNPFDGKGADAPTVTPVNGFDDTNGVSVGIQSAVAEFGRILPQTGEMVNNPWGDLGATNGEGRYNFKERFGTEFTDADLPEIENEEDFQWYKSLANKSDQELRDIFGSDRIPRQVAVISDPAFSSYENYKEFRDKVTGENAYTAAKSWDQNLQESIERFATYAPNEATVGVAAGQIARIAAEQFALSLLTGGALSANNIVKSIGDLGVKGGKALGIIKTGQELAATSSNTAKILSAMASGSAEGLNAASKIIYGLGKIGTWAVREVGEDAVRGLIDDVLVGNSLDSQGNLDGSKFLENVYMNAIMAAIGKAPGTIAKAIFTVLDADKTIDGVKIPVGAKTQLNKLAQAASGSADSAVKAIDEDGHPIITHAGKDERLDQVTLTKENANKLVPEQAPTKTLEEAVAEGDDAGKAIENIAKEAGMDTPLKPGDNTKIENAPDPEATKNKIERKLDDDDIRRKFPNGKVSINGEEYILDVKNANLGDLASANGSTIKNFGDGASKLAASAKQGLRSFQESLNGVLQHADEFAKGWKEAVEKFASDNGVGVRDVIIALRDLRIDGTESIPGLKQLWEEHWAPYANQLLDAQDNLTKIKTNRQNYYQRDMIAGTVKIDGEKVSVDQSTVSNLLGIDSDFDLTASSRKANKQKITDDKLETNPELLAKEFVLSRVETIKKYSKQGKIISVMREALDDGEELTQYEAAESLRATKKIGDDIRNSKEVQDIADSVTDQKALDNVDNLNFEMDAKVNSDPEVKRIDKEIEKQKADIESKKAQLEETNKPSEDGKISESNLREAPWAEKTKLGPDGYNYAEKNTDIPGVSGGAGKSAKDTLSKGISDGEANLKKLNDERAKAVEQAKKRISSEGLKTEAQQTAENKQIVDSVADTTKNTADQRQDAFEKAANKSNAAELISSSSKYKKRAKHQATQNPIGVNFMPGNPFGKFASWINDNFIKSQSIQIKEGDRIYSAYSGGYSLYAESTSWARQIILDIRDGKTLTDAIYRVLQQNGVKVEPTEYAINKYGAKTSPQKDFEKASAIAERLSKSRLWGKAVKDGKVVNTELLGAMLAKELRRQGASEFFRFLKKSDFSTFTKGQQKWLNAQAYKMIASFDPKASRRIRAGIQKAMGLVMGAKYRSNMYGNLKNAQLQLTEIQRLFTLNGLGDFAKTIKRLITDSEFRTKISDAAYIYASDSMGQGLTKQDVEMMRQVIDSNLAAADASTMTPKGIITAINNHFQKGAKAAIDGADNDLLGAIQGAEYFKNYMLLAGIVQSAETKNLSGMAADAYIRNRFNTEALAGTNIGRIGLTDSALGRLTFMYLGFPIRELTLQAHIIKGGGTLGGSTKLDKVIGGIAYAEKMLGAKGLVWALEAPWGYKFADVIGYDPFGLTDNRSDTEDNKNVDFWAGIADFSIQNNPILQGAIGSAFVDVYMAYREAYEDAKDEWLETHDSLEGFDWVLDDAPNEQIWQTFGAGFTPGYTAFSRAANEAQDLDRGFRISSTGNRLYETNQDSGSALWGMVMGRTNTRNAMNYYQIPDPIRGLTERGLPGLGQAFERAMPFRLNRLEGAQYGDRNFREFDPTDSYSYSDWFDGSWADEQNWITGYYAFREEAEEIRDRANEGVNQSNALEKIASREAELADLRERVERYVQAYLNKHPEGISNAKMQQVQRIFNMDLPDAGNTLNRVLGDYSDYEKNYAANRVAQGNFPSSYGFSSTPYTDQDGVSKGDYKYARNAQLENILQTQQYGVQSDVGRVIAQLDDTLVPTPFGSMSFSDYRKKVQNEISKEYSKSKVDYDHISDLQSQYLDVFDMIIRPIFSTYGSGILQSGKSSDVMQQFSSMLNGLIPSDEYRVDKKGRRIRQSTPYMTVDIKKWLQRNYGSYPARNTTDNDSEARLRGIRNDMDAGRVAVARAKAIAFIEDLREGRVSVDRDRLVELQNILRGGYDKNSVTGGGNLNTGLNR